MLQLHVDFSLPCIHMWRIIRNVLFSLAGDRVKHIKVFLNWHFLKCLHPLQFVLKRPNSPYLTVKNSAFVFLVRLYMWIREGEFCPKRPKTSAYWKVTAIYSSKVSKTTCHIFLPYSIYVFCDVNVCTVKILSVHFCILPVHSDLL